MGTRHVLTLKGCELRTMIVCDKCGLKEVQFTTNNDTSNEKKILEILGGAIYISNKTITYYFKGKNKGRKSVTFKKGEAMSLHDYSQVMRDIYETETYMEAEGRLVREAVKNISESRSWFYIKREFSLRGILDWLFNRYLLVCKDCADKHQDEGGEVTRMDYYTRPGTGRVIEREA